MADDQTPDPTLEENPSGIPKTANPGDQFEPPYQIMTQYVKDLSFENPNAPGIFTTATVPQAQLLVDVQTHSLGGRDVEVSIHVEATAERDGQKAYVLELVYAGVVRIGQIPKEALNALLYIEVPRMLFPFVREAVCTATRNGGFPELFLATFDFTRLYRNRLAQAQQAEDAATQDDPAQDDPADA